MSACLSQLRPSLFGKFFMAATASLYVWIMGSFAGRFAMFLRVGLFLIFSQADSQAPDQTARPVIPSAVAPFMKSRREKKLRSSIFSSYFDWTTLGDSEM